MILVTTILALPGKFYTIGMDITSILVSLRFDPSQIVLVNGGHGSEFSAFFASAGKDPAPNTVDKIEEDTPNQQRFQ